jgi:hypothetical protein
MSQTDLTGGLVNYYLVKVNRPQRTEQPPYQAECEDIIRALGMTFDEGCEFKAIWRTAAARQGNGKPGTKAIYDAEKRVHYATASLRALQTDVPPPEERKKHASFIAPRDFIPWLPGPYADPPVGKNQEVEIFFRGVSEPVKSETPFRASMLRWEHNGNIGDIVAYRVVK